MLIAKLSIATRVTYWEREAQKVAYGEIAPHEHGPLIFAWPAEGIPAPRINANGGTYRGADPNPDGTYEEA